MMWSDPLIPSLDLDLGTLGEVEPSLSRELDEVAEALKTHPGLLGVKDLAHWLLEQVGCLRNIGNYASDWYSEERQFDENSIYRFAIELGRQLLHLPYDGVTVGIQAGPRVMDRYKNWFSLARTFYDMRPERTYLPPAEAHEAIKSSQAQSWRSGESIATRHRDRMDAAFIPAGFRARFTATRKDRGDGMSASQEVGPRVIFLTDPTGMEVRGQCRGIRSRWGEWIAYRVVHVLDLRDEKLLRLQAEARDAWALEMERQFRERQAAATTAMQQTITPQLQQARQALHQDRLHQEQMEAELQAQQFQQQMAMQQMMQQQMAPQMMPQMAPQMPQMAPQMMAPPMHQQPHMAFPQQFYGEGEAMPTTAAPKVAKIERRAPVQEPSPEKPILAWQARDQYGQPQGPPLPVNPQQALRLMGREPDPLTLAERNYYSDLAGLGRFAIEMAADGANDPAELGALGSLTDALYSQLVNWGGRRLSRAFPDRSWPEAVTMGLEALPRLMRLVRSAPKSSRDRRQYWRRILDEALDAVEAKAGKVEKKRGLLKRLFGAGDDGTLEEGSLDRSTFGLGNLSNPNGIALALGLLEAGHAALKRQGKEKSAAGLAALDRLAGADLGALATGRHAGYRPTLGDYSLACCCKAPTKDVQQLSHYAALGGFDPNDPKASTLAAVGRLGLSNLFTSVTRALAPDAEKFVSQVSNVVQNVGRTVDQAFQSLPKDAEQLTRPMVEAARASLDQLRASEERLQQQATMIKRMEQAMAAVQQRLNNVESVRQQDGATVTQIAAAEAAIAQLHEGQKKLAEQMQRAMVEWRAEQEKMRAAAATAKPIVQAAQQAKVVADKEEQIRVTAAKQMHESGLGRGSLITLSEREYADMIREREESRAAIKETERQAKALAEARKKDITRLASMKEEEERLRNRLAELESQLTTKSQESEVRAEKEKAREQLVTRVRELQQSFEDQLRTIREATAEAIEKASDVTNQSGMQMMFDFLGRLVGAMRQVKDVSSASEFLQLFPRVLDQLRRAQQIAQPQPPRVDVTVPTPTFSPRFEPRFEIDPSLFITPATQPEPQPQT